MSEWTGKTPTEPGEHIYRYEASTFNLNVVRLYEIDGELWYASSGEPAMLLQFASSHLVGNGTIEWLVR